MNNFFIAQKLKEEADWEKAKARNNKSYFTDLIREYNNKIVATCDNWNYVLKVYTDNSAGLDCIAKPGSGCHNCSYAGTNILKSHLIHLTKYRKNPHPGIIPEDWTILEPGFFKALEII